MDAFDALMTRRSIRKFTQRPVSQETVAELLRAAMAAPSAGNQQPWHFVVIRDRATLDAVADGLPYAAMAREAQAAVLVCGDAGLGKHPGFWVQDCSAATQNLLLAAHACGLGAVWVGVHPREDRMALMRSLCRVPEPVVPFSVVPLGYPAEEIAAVDRFDAGRIHNDHWQERT